MSEPIPVPELGHIVECMICHKDMVINPYLMTWEGHPGFRHLTCEAKKA